MKKTVGFLLLFAAGSISAMAQGSIKASITLSNPSGIERSNEVISISWASVLSRYPDIDTANFKVLDAATKKEIPFQLEHKGQPGIQNLLLQLTLKAKATVKLNVLAGKPANVPAKTYARFVPERFDDFAWENDKAAFRMYGKALETRKDNAFGMDHWSKKTDKLILNDWYKKDDYHTDHGEGMDYYHVGFTLGGGDIAPILKDSIVYPKNYHHWKILDNGPLRSTFELGYDEWNVAGKAVKVVKRISLDAGSQMNRIEAVYQYNNSADLPVAIGIIKRGEPGTILMEEQKGILGYWEPQHGADGTTGVGTIVLGDKINMGADQLHFLTYTTAKNNQPVIYYSGSVWDKAKEISSATQWFNYLINFKEKLAHPITVVLN